MRHRVSLALLAALLVLSSVITTSVQSAWSQTSSTVSHLSWTESRGAKALTAFDQLPYLRRGTTVAQVSSFDRTGGNNDGSGSYLYRNAQTEGYVVLESFGAGTIYRMWATDYLDTGIGLEGSIRLYFDGEETPRVDLPLEDFFSGTHPPFLFPLVGNNQSSSGGFYSYYPFAFREGMRVEFTVVPGYYNITYHTYNTAEGMDTFTGTEDLTAAFNAWRNPTVDPKDKTTNRTFAEPSFDLLAGQTRPIFETSAGGSVRSIELTIPQLIPTQYKVRSKITDNGRAHRGESDFGISIDPANQGIVLTRRLDYSIANQTADVYIDDQLAGRWADQGSNTTDRWRDSQFPVNEHLTMGKSSVRVSIRFVSSACDWNEFRYWVESILPAGQHVGTDALDVGDAASEASHSYTIVQETWEGTRTSYYPEEIKTSYDQATIDLLANVHLVAYWDDETIPSVDAPLGFFFGTGSGGEGLVNSLLMGTEPSSHKLYNYFPMPYASKARVYLVNGSNTDVRQMSSEVQYDTSTYEGLGSSAGYFTVVHNRQAPTNTGVDFPIVALPNASGHLVALVMSVSDNTTDRILEGDERVFTDAAGYNPQVHGTGTEDCFNAGWYFANGVFTLPVHGAPLRNWYGGSSRISLYRLFVSDTIPFEQSLTFNMEHCNTNDCNASYESAAFLYLSRSPSPLIQTDVLTIGDAASEAAHEYVTSEDTSETPFAGTFFGRAPDDEAQYVGTIAHHHGYSGFSVSVSPDNTGVRLARILDQASGNQRARVFVDGSLAGEWFTGGGNAVKRARYDTLEISPSLTQGKRKLNIAVQFIAGDQGWNEAKWCIRQD